MRASMFLVALLAAVALLTNAAPLGRRHERAGDVTTVVLDAAATGTGEQYRTVVRRVQDASGGHLQQDVTVALSVDVNTDGTLAFNGVAIPLGASTHQVVADVAEIPGVPPPTVEASVSLHVTKGEVDTPRGPLQAYVIREWISETAGSEVHETFVVKHIFEHHRNGQAVKRGVAWIHTDDQPIVKLHIGEEPTTWTSERHAHGGQGKHGHHGSSGGGGSGDGDYHHRPHEPAQTEPADSDVAPPSDVVAPAPADASEPVAAPSGCRLGQSFHRVCASLRGALGRFHDMLSGLPLVLRAIIAFALGAATGYITLSLLSCCFGRRCCKSCRKTAPSTYDTNLQVYALQYTALPADEKEALKKEQQKEGEIVVTV